MNLKSFISDKKLFLYSRFLLIFFVFINLLISCKKREVEEQNSINNTSSKSLVKYAHGFDIQIFETYKKLIIKSPYPDAENIQEFILISNNSSKKKRDVSGKKLVIPLKEIVATSTTHIPMIELLHEEKSLIGFPNTDYISSPKTRNRINQGLVIEIGNEIDINTEILISLQPDAVIGFTMGNTINMYDLIEKNGIPVIYNSEWLEKTPLGRAEWIKFFGVLFDKDKEADSIFKIIENKYNSAKEKARLASHKPSILTGVLYKDKWNLPAGDSFTAQLLKDANTNYLWGETKGQGSLVLSLESVLDKARNADFWIGSGYYTSLEEMGNANNHYKEFRPFIEKNIYTFSKKRGESGGVLYFELAPIQPHIVLQDLISIVHPEMLADYDTFFLEKVE